MDHFSRAWTALRAAVADVADEDFARPSGCAGWLVRDLVCHLIIDAQDILITLVTPADTEPTRTAISYWHGNAATADPDATAGGDVTAGGDATADRDDFDALVVRLAAAYGEPRFLKFHFDDVGAAAGRAAELVDPSLLVSTQGFVLTAADYRSAYVLEWTLHHLDLVAHLPGIAGPPAECLATARWMLTELAGAAFPASFTDTDVLLVGTGRRSPTVAERTSLGALAERLPLALG